MYRWENGVQIELTQEEIAAMEAEQANMPAPEPTSEERISALESAMLAMMGGCADV